MQPSALTTTDPTPPASSRQQALLYYKEKIHGCLSLPGQVPIALVELGRWAVAVRDQQLYDLEQAPDIYHWMYRQFRVRATQSKKLLAVGDALTPEEIAPLTSRCKLGLEMLYQVALLDERLRPVVYQQLAQVRGVAALAWAREQAQLVLTGTASPERAAQRLREAIASGLPPQEPRAQLRAQIDRLRGLVNRLRETGGASAEQLQALEEAITRLEQQVQALPTAGKLTMAAPPEALPEPPPEPLPEPPPAPAPPAPIVIHPSTWRWLLRCYAPEPPPPLPASLTHEHPKLWCDELCPAVAFGVLSPRVYRVAWVGLLLRVALFRRPIALNPLALAPMPADAPAHLREERRSWQMLLALGRDLLQHGRLDAAAQLLRRSLQVAEAIEGDASPAVAEPLLALAELASQEARHREAADLVRRALPHLPERGFTAEEVAAYRDYVENNDRARGA